jgi:multidrug resistance efflux pump
MARSLFNSPRKVILWIIVIVLIIYIYFVVVDFYTPSTGDAKVCGFAIEIAPAVDGKIEEVFVVDNQFVKEGDLLFKLDSREYQANLKIAEGEKQSIQAKFNYAKAAASRYKLLTVSDFISKLSYEEVQRNLNSEHGQLNKIQAEIWYNTVQIERSLIHAPTDGFVSKLRIQKGYFAKKGDLQLTLVNSSQKWIEVNIKESNLERIQEGQEALVSFGVYPGQLFSGRVKSIAAGITEDEDLPKNYLPHVEPKQEWIRLAQRIPIHIILDENEKVNLDALRLGSSSVVTIYTTSNPILRAFAFSYHWLRSKAYYFI